VPATRHRSLLWIGYLALTAYFLWPLLKSWTQLGLYDWDVVLLYYAAVFKSVYEFGSLPFWNPWYCGGHVLWQNPQVALLSPMYPLLLIAPLPVAMKLNVLLHYLVGFAGMHLLLTRQLGVTYPPTILVLASLFTLAGGPALHLAVGHATFLPYFYLPWLLLLFLSALETGRIRYATMAAGVVALMLFNGGLHIAFMSGVAFATFALAASVLRRDWRPLALIVIVGIGACLFYSPQLLPISAFLGNPGFVDGRSLNRAGDRMTMAMLEHSLVDPYQYLRLRLEEGSHGWHEYGNYIGSFGALILAASFVWLLLNRPGRERWLAASLAAAAAAALALAMGEFSAYAPFALISQLPVVSSLRVPSRFSLMFVFFGTATAGAVARHLEGEWLAGDGRGLRGLGRFVTVLALLGIGFLASVNREHLGYSFPLADLRSSFHLLQRPPAPLRDATTQGFGGDSPMTRAIMQNRDVLACYEPLSQSGQIRSDKPVVFADEGRGAGAGNVSDISFSPRRVEFTVMSNAPTRLFLNQRYVPGWRSDLGPIAVDPDSTLGFVTLPAATNGRFAMWFTPPRLAEGLALFGLGVLLALVTWNRTLRTATETP
jgi:hypothetical protein